MSRLLDPDMPSLLRTIACLAVMAPAWTPVAVLRAQPSVDEFLVAHHAAAALNRPRVDLQIRFKGGRTTFNPREPIEIELVFDLDPGAGVLDFMPEDPCRGWPLAEVVIDRQDGVSTPQRHLCGDLAERIPGGVLGGVPGGSIPGVGGAPLPKLPPVVLPLTVNDWHRFDRPGVYRLYVRSAHTTGDGSEFPRQVSNILALTIGARDDAYERRRAIEAPRSSPNRQSTRVSGVPPWPSCAAWRASMPHPAWLASTPGIGRRRTRPTSRWAVC